MVIGSKRNADPGSSCQVGGRDGVGVGSISMKRPLKGGEGLCSTGIAS